MEVVWKVNCVQTEIISVHQNKKKEQKLPTGNYLVPFPVAKHAHVLLYSDIYQKVHGVRTGDCLISAVIEIATGFTARNHLTFLLPFSQLFEFKVSKLKLPVKTHFKCISAPSIDSIK